MFSSLGIFDSVTCPCHEKCSLLRCLFNHNHNLQQHRSSTTQQAPERPTKRQKVDHDDCVSVSNLSTTAMNNVSNITTERISKTPAQSGDAPNGVGTHIVPSKNETAQSAMFANVHTTSRTISPPPVRRKQPPASWSSPKSDGAAQHIVQETLNPRILRHDPAGHQSRTLYLRKLHEQMSRLNDETIACEDPAIRVLVKTRPEMISMALDEEEKIALESPTVYSNVIKQRMMLYKKMTLDQWKQLRLKDRSKNNMGNFHPEHLQRGGKAKSIDTGLSRDEEMLILGQLKANLTPLTKYGYVNVPPSGKEVQTAKDGVASAKGWEKCDRCDSRFQVFPDRREDGALTSGGKCTHHYGRMLWPVKDRLDASKGQQSKTWSCCSQSIGTAGCTVADTHVFKVSDPKRLASLLQFECTPANPHANSTRAICFDCEMGYTVNGLELMRLTAVSWPDGEELLDVLVKPLGTILDLNTRFSGITAEQVLNALPYQAKTVTSDRDMENKHRQEAEDRATSHLTPRIVESPMAARALLFGLISPSTPLLGHAIENDLNVVRIVHPTIVDTVLLFPHPRGLPFRKALKTLSKDLLSRDIQIESAAGHDSKEDAIATGDLVRVKVGQKWRSMQQAGWKLHKGELVPPDSPQIRSNVTNGTMEK